MTCPTLWIFGSSFCLPYNVENDKAWPNLVSKELNLLCNNFSQPAADNFFIYHTYLENRDKIKSTDIVIIGWSHYSRKSFVFDKQNPEQLAVLEKSIFYKTETQEFLRSINSDSGLTNFINMKPINRGLLYYDNWFMNYYSKYEQLCNLQSYIDSVKLSCLGSYIPFYFSKESIGDIEVETESQFIVEFIKDNNVAISSTDGHLNEYGHRLWANYIVERINNN